MPFYSTIANPPSKSLNSANCRHCRQLWFAKGMLSNPYAYSCTQIRQRFFSSHSCRLLQKRPNSAWFFLVGCFTALQFAARFCARISPLKAFSSVCPSIDIFVEKRKFIDSTLPSYIVSFSVNKYLFLLTIVPLGNFDTIHKESFHYLTTCPQNTDCSSLFYSNDAAKPFW